MANITERKDQHIEAVLHRDVRARAVTTGLEHVRFEHNALPELTLADIDLSTTFLGRRMTAPLLISSMTGGPRRAADINLNIAQAAEALGLAFAVGSQRVALEGAGSAGIDIELRRRAPSVPILANLGAAQLLDGAAVDRAERAVAMIAADALIVHLNPVQEAVQAGGDTDWRGVLAAIGGLVRRLPVPVCVKEVGFGLSGDVVRRLSDLGVTLFDVAGAGGTSWAAVEAERAETASARAVAEAFRDWGIPTADAIRTARRVAPDATIIASGGLTDGIDCAKALRLGADLCGQAAGVLTAAIAGTEPLCAHLRIVIEQLRIVAFATGSGDLAALKSARLLPSPPERG
jgi:isopentenyl-diphosphate delta-isomerase